MIKFMILFDQPEDPENFENVYQDLLALLERMPNIMRRQVVHVTDSPQGAPKVYRILELYFLSMPLMQDALLSAVGQEAGRELNGRLSPDTFQVFYADVYEEAGGSTAPVVPASQGKAAADDKAAAQASSPTE